MLWVPCQAQLRVQPCCQDMEGLVLVSLPWLASCVLETEHIKIVLKDNVPQLVFGFFNSWMKTVTLACRVSYRILCSDSRILKLYDVLHSQIYLLSTFPGKKKKKENNIPQAAVMILCQDDPINFQNKVKFLAL